jgi:hypothetical protein
MQTCCTDVPWMCDGHGGLARLGFVRALRAPPSDTTRRQWWVCWEHAAFALCVIGLVDEECSMRTCALVVCMCRDAGDASRLSELSMVDRLLDLSVSCAFSACRCKSRLCTVALHSAAVQMLETHVAGPKPASYEPSRNYSPLSLPTSFKHTTACYSNTALLDSIVSLIRLPWATRVSPYGTSANDRNMLTKFETKSNRVKGLSFHPKRCASLQPTG